MVIRGENQEDRGAVELHQGIEPKRKRLKKGQTGFPGGAAVKNLPANAGDMGSSPGPGRSHMPRSN